MKYETELMIITWFLLASIIFAGSMLIYIHRTKEKNFWSRVEKDRCTFMLRQPKYFPNDQEYCKKILRGEKW